MPQVLDVTILLKELNATDAKRKEQTEELQSEDIFNLLFITYLNFYLTFLFYSVFYSTKTYLHE